MAIAERSAQSVWEGDLAHGKGTVNGSSGALNDLEVDVGITHGALGR